MRTCWKGLCFVLLIPGLFVESGCNRATSIDGGANSTSAAEADKTAKTSEPFQLKGAVSAGGQEVEFKIYFVDHHAAEMPMDGSDEPVAIYDLREKTWRDESTPRPVRQEECEAWAKASVERTQKSLNQETDVRVRNFVSASINPQFETTAGENRLALANKFLRFEIRETQTVSEDQFDRVLVFDRINAYRKAMTEQKLPPFVQLAVDKELAARRIFPNEAKFSATMPSGEVQISTSLRLEPMTPEEQKLVRAKIASRLSASTSAP